MSEALRGVVAVVDVRLRDAEEASDSFRAMLVSMGAQVRTTLAKDVTHLVWQNGKRSSLDKALARPGVHIVSSLWLDRCSQTGQRAEERDYAVSADGTAAPTTKRYSREPKPLPPLTLAAAVRAAEAEADALLDASFHGNAASEPASEGDAGAVLSKRLVFTSDMSDDTPLVPTATTAAVPAPVSSPSLGPVRRASNSKLSLAAHKARQTPLASSPGAPGRASTEGDAAAAFDFAVSQPSQGLSQSRLTQSSPDWMREPPRAAGTNSPAATYKRARLVDEQPPAESPTAAKPPLAPPALAPAPSAAAGKKKALAITDEFDGNAGAASPPPSVATVALKMIATPPEDEPEPEPERKPAAAKRASKSTPGKRVAGTEGDGSSAKKRRTAETPSPLRETSHNNSSNKPAAAAASVKSRRGAVVLTSMPAARRDVCVSTLRHFGQFTFTEKVDATTTHVICGEPRRTLAVMHGMLQGSWVVSSEWLLESLSKETLLPEEQFELRELFPGATAARKAAQAGTPLFARGFNTFFVGETKAPTETIAALARAAGAEITDDPKRATLCIGAPFVGKGSRRAAVPIELQVNESWLFDCITAYAQLDISQYALQTASSAAKSPSF